MKVNVKILAVGHTDNKVWFAVQDTVNHIDGEPCEKVVFSREVIEKYAFIGAGDIVIADFVSKNEVKEMRRIA